jgi:hypothetical protein
MVQVRIIGGKFGLLVILYALDKTGLNITDFA